MPNRRPARLGGPETVRGAPKPPRLREATALVETARDGILGGRADGLEILRLLRRQRPELPVFLLMAYLDGELEQKARKLLGSGAVLAKSDGPERLLECVDRALRAVGASS